MINIKMDSSESVEQSLNGGGDSAENSVSEPDKSSDDISKEEAVPSASNAGTGENVSKDPWIDVKCVYCNRLLCFADGPKLLDCLHSSCDSCINSRIREQERGNEEVIVKSLDCPICGLSYVPGDIIDNKFLVEKYENEDEAKPKDIICTSCAEGNPAASWCVNCSEFICSACVEAHHRLKITKDHTIQSKDEANAEKEARALSSVSQRVNCPIHTQEKLTLFCETCDLLTCRDCQLTSHRDHKYKFIDEIANEARSVIKGLLGEVCYKRVLLSSAIKVIDERQEVIKSRRTAIISEITEMVVKLTTALNKRGKVLVQCLTEMCDAKQTTLTQKRAALKKLALLADHCINFVEGALKHGTDTALLFSKKPLGGHLKRIKSYKADIPNPEMPVRINFLVEGFAELEKALTSLGKISVDGRPSMNPTAGPPASSPVSSGVGNTNLPTSNVSVANMPSTSALGIFPFAPQKTDFSPPHLTTQNYKSTPLSSTPQSSQQPLHQGVIQQVTISQPYTGQISYVQQGRPSYPQAITTVAISPQGHPTQLSSSHPSNHGQSYTPATVSGIPRQMPANQQIGYQIMTAQQIPKSAPNVIIGSPQFSNTHRQQTQQRTFYPQQQLQNQTQQYIRPRPIIPIAPSTSGTFPVRGPVLLTQQQVSSSTHPGHANERRDINLKGLLSHNSLTTHLRPIAPKVMPQNTLLPSSQGPSAQVPKPSHTLHHHSMLLPNNQLTTPVSSVQNYPPPPPYPNLPPLIPVTTARVRSNSLSPSYRSSAPVPIQQSWHIPQSDNNAQDTGLVAVVTNNSDSVMGDGLPFKITIRSSNSLQQTNSLSGDGAKGHQVTSSAQESSKDSSKKDETKSLDEFCQESVKDLMDSIAAHIDGDSLMQGGTSKQNDITHSDLSAASTSTSESTRISGEQQVLVDSSTGSPCDQMAKGDGISGHKRRHHERSNNDIEIGEPRSPKGDDPNEDWCAVCMDGGELVCCDRCPKVYHIYCHIPPLTAIPGPSEAWQCLLCTSIDDILSTPLGSRMGSSRGLSLRDLKLVQRILLELYCLYEPSLAFRELPECEGYLDVIRRPMSLDVIRNKLNAEHPKHYRDLAEFIQDVRLVFSNAFTFNPEGTQIYSDARTLEDFFNQLLRKWLPIYFEDVDDNLADSQDDDEDDDDDFASPPRRRRKSK